MAKVMLLWHGKKSEKTQKEHLAHSYQKNVVLFPRSWKQFSHARSEQFKIGVLIIACLCHRGSVLAVLTGKVKFTLLRYPLLFFPFPVIN